MTDLNPVDPSLCPFGVGEKVAFRENHKKHPGMYGVIQQIGVDKKGVLTFDLAVHDPATGATDGDTVFRANLGDIQ